MENAENKNQGNYSREILPLVQTLLRKLFDIHEGEGTRACLMLLYIFCIISSLMIVKPVATSLFLSKFGASHLPNAFMLVAVFAAAVATIYSKLLNRVRLKKIIKGTLQGAITALLVFWSFLYFNREAGWILYIFYVWVAIFAVISASQFWILANLLFNAREAKRLYGFIGSGAISGGIFGGYLTNFTAPIIGSENLIFVSIAFLAICIFITTSVWKRTARSDHSYQFQQQRKIASTDTHPLRLIKHSRHLTYLASIVGIGVVVGKLVEYQFSVVATASIPEEDQLTAFFGFWLSNLNIISLMIQLFLTRRVVGVFGVGTSLFFLPIGVLFGAFSLLIFPSLWTAIMLKISDGSLKNSINKAGIELLALPIPPETKNQAKAFIDVFVDSFATGIGGILLFILTIVLSFSVQYVSLVLILLIIGWLYLARQIRQEYLESLRVQIERTKDEPEPHKPELQRESVLGGLLKVLDGDDENQILSVLKMVLEFQNARLIPAFKKLIHHPSAAVRLAVLENIYFYKTSAFLKEATALLADPDDRIKTEAMEYLFQHSDNPVGMLHDYLQHEDYQLRGAALLCAANESRKNQTLKEIMRIREVVEETVKQIPHKADRKEAEFDKANSSLVIGATNIPELYPYLHIFLNSRSHAVLQAAISGAARTGQSEFILPIIQNLGTENLTGVARRALVTFGEQAIKILASHLENPDTEKSIRLSIPKTIAAFKTQQAVDILSRNLDQPNLSLRHEVIRALNRLRNKLPHIKINEQQIVPRIMEETKNYMDSLAVLYLQTNAQLTENKTSEERSVKDARGELLICLEQRLDRNLERIFRLLGLKYPPADIYDAYLGIQKNNPQTMRLTAVEFLDTLLEPDLKKIIIPIVETTVVNALIDDALEKFGLGVPTEFECFTKLLTGDDDLLKILTLKLIGNLKDETYIPSLGVLINNPNRQIKEMAKFALTEIGIYEDKSK